MKLIKAGKGPFVRKYRNNYWITHKDEKNRSVRTKFKIGCNFDVRNMQNFRGRVSMWDGDFLRANELKEVLADSVASTMISYLQNLPFWISTCYREGDLIEVDQENNAVIYSYKGDIYERPIF